MASTHSFLKRPLDVKEDDIKAIKPNILHDFTSIT